MKKIISLSLATCMILTMFFQITLTADAAEDLKPLPEVGKVISGFKAVEIGSMDMVNSKTVLFEHEKTGAKLLYIQNNDIDKSFDITFRTPAADNTGVNHVLEHVSVSGSQKYPAKNGLFSIVNQTYSTYANAFTYQNFTTYPVSSMSEAQLLKLTDAYLNGVYQPLINTDKNIFLREAWRYEMEDSSSPLTLTGTVYNEMKGSLGNISAAASRNVLTTLFPNSTQSYISGGKPENIKDLTYEQLIKTHDTYYHPSNSLMILYGNLDYEKFLKLIEDEYLSKYDRKEIKIDTGKIAPFRSMAEKTYRFPAGKASNTKNASQIDYAYALTDISDEENIGMKIVAEILNQDTSPLEQAFNEKQIGGNVSVSFDDSTPQPVLTFSAQNSDESKAKEFKAVVDKCIGDIVKKGFDKSEVDAVIDSSILSSSNLTQIGNLGVNLSKILAQLWANSGSINQFNNSITNIKNIGAKEKDGYLENLVKKLIVNNTHAALVLTVPEAGLAEKQDMQQQKYLDDLKASMNKQEIDKIVTATRLFKEWNGKESDANIVKALQAVKVADLPESIKKYDIKESLLAGGIRVLSAEANIGETAKTSLLFDISGVPVEKLHYLQLYSGLLGSMDTKTYTREKLNTLATRYLNGFSSQIIMIQQKDSQKFTPYLEISWMGVASEYKKQTELVKDIIINTSFDNTNDIYNKVKAQIANMKAYINGEPIYTQMVRSRAHFGDMANYQNYISGLDYYDFLIKLEKTLASDPASVEAGLKEIRGLVSNKTNMTAAFIGSSSYVKNYEDAIKIVLDDLPAKSIAAQDYTKIPKPALREGIAVDSAVQYNMISASYDTMGTVFSGKFLPIQLLINEKYTTPEIRFKNGAYDNIVNFDLNGFCMASYRDPNIKETFEIYKGLPGFIKNINITQEDLDRFIIKAFGANSVSSGELAGASDAITSYLSGYSTEDRQKILHEIKSVTVQDVKDSAELLDKFIKNGAYSTAGSLQKLTQNKELYDAIISVDSTSASVLTRAELFEMLLSGVPNPLEVAKQQGLLAGDGKGGYKADEMLTKEELAVIIYKVAALNGKKLTGNEVKISDMASVSAYAKERVSSVVNSGVMKPDSKGNFNPKEGVTAVDVQTILTDLMSNLNGK